MKIIYQLKLYLNKLKDILTNAAISIGYKLYDRIITPKKNVKDLSIKNYATINIEKEYKYRKINDLGLKVLYNPTFSIVHDAQRTSRKSFKHFIWHITSMFRYLSGI